MSASKEALLRQLLASKGVRPAAMPDAAPTPRPFGEAPVLSFAQERLWFVQQLQPENTAYLLGQAFTLRGPLDAAALSAAWIDVVRRHEVLRSGLPERDGRAALAILPPEAVALVTEDVSQLATAEQASAVAARTRDVLETPFDLARPPLVRIHLLRLGVQEHRLLFCVHHLVFDGWSIGILLGDLATAYAARASGAKTDAASVLPPCALSYADYAVWQRRRAATPAWAEALRAWEQRLAGVPVLTLPVDHRRPDVLSGRGAGHRFTLPPALVAQLRALGSCEQATLFMTLLAAWQVVLARYSGQTDFGVGSPVANRSHPSLEGIVGFFVNMIVLRADLAGDPDFRALLRRTAAEVQAALARQEIPFDQIVERLKVPRDPAHHPLFQAGFTFLNAPAGAARLAGVELTAIEADLTSSKFDLLLALEETPAGGLCGVIEYSTDLFVVGTIRRLAANLETLLASAVATPDVSCSRLALVSPAEAAEPVPQVARVPEPAGRENLAMWFRAVARREASRVAVTDGTTSLTYAELDAKSDQLAAFLHAQGVGPDRLVAIAMERSTLLIVAMLGVVKAGGGYLPVDPAYPLDRQAFMIEDGAAVLVLTEASLIGRIAEVAGVHQVPIDSDWPAIAATRAPERELTLQPEHTAYVIYTSGSTGKPKGVPVTHRNVCRLFTQTEPWFGFGPDDVWTMFHSFAFDFSVWEIWGALLYGGRLVVVPYAVSRATDQFYAWLARERVTVLNQTPSAFRQLSQHEESLAAPPSLALRCVVFGGEALDLGLLAPWIARHGDKAPRLINMYGITETTVHVTYREITAEDVRAGCGSVIGVPIPDLELHLVDAYLQPVPRGVAGEILVGGEGLARGYLNRPELTAERFISHPLAAGSGGRLYRSGDLARRLDNGDIEYLGRIDFQVKIRGFRIELGEIESALGKHPDIAAACVLAERGTGGDARLLAWLVGRNGVVVTVEALRSHLQAFLPDYMVPAVFTWVDRLPLTTNGKIDRAALRALEGRRAEAGAEHVAPAGPAETLLAGVWAEVLGVPTVGVTDNFFALGGDSIRSIEVRSKVRARGWDFPLQDLFRHQTVRELAAVLVPAVEANAGPGAFALVSAEDRARLPSGVVDAYPLTALQAGMVFHSELHPETSVFHDLFSYHLRVAWDEGVLRAVLADIVRRHPILRTSVHKGGFAEPLQCVHASIALPLTVQDLTALDPQAQEAAVAAWWDDEKARGFDWIQPGLFRICVHRRTAATLQFSLSLHHAIMDGWSVAAFLTEIFSRYLARLAGGGEAAQADRLAPAFRDFVGLERDALASETTRQFWRTYLDDPQVIRLPRRPDRAPVDTTMARQDAVFLTWRDDRYDALKALAARAGVSLKHVLLAAHARVVSFLGNQPDVITGVISNGRPEEGDVAEGLGLFLNTVPFRIRAAEGGTWLDLIQAALRADETVYPHRRYPLAELQKTWGRQTLFETAFNFVHFHVFDALRDRPDLAVLDSRFFDQNTFAYFAQFSADGPARSLQLELRYDPAEFTREQVIEFADLYDRVLAAMAATPESRVREHGLLSPQAWATLRGFNANAFAHDRSLRLHEGFERVAKATPAAIALVDENRRFTYAELDARANAWASQLRAQGAGPEKLVGVCLERSADLVTALLAVLKTGAAYVPLDPLYPADRLGFMCEDAQVRLLVSRPSLVAKLPKGDWALVDVTTLAVLPPKSETFACSARPENLAYLIYTSGSTGRPKATAIEHRSAVALIAWARAVYPPEELAGVLAATSVCFDLSIFELFVTLALGGKVILAENALALPELPARGEVTLVNTVPSAMNELIRSGALPANVRVVNLAGEPLPAALADKIYATGTVEKVYDLYGPSEDTTYSTCALRVRGGPETIGRPLANTQLYLLDSALQPVPLGAVGELFLGGEGLARGYLGRPDLTAERFIPDPFATTPGGRLYRTGDLGRFRPDGQVEFLGRSDHQIKIRGFRIELGEIEAVLRTHPQVSEAAVIAREDEPGRKQLVAYVVGATLSTGRALDTDLRAWLSARLPEYFVPAAFVALVALPQTPNGKLDRKALPAPASATPAAGEPDDFVAPRTSAEQALARIWTEVLKVPRVGLHDNYFALGGDSILVLQVVARARATGLALSPRLVFERPTVAELADAAGIADAAGGNTEEAVDGPWPLLPIHRWFFAQDFSAAHHWNQSVLLTTRELLEPGALEAALKAVVAHHPALRLRFTRTEQAPGGWSARPHVDAVPVFRTKNFGVASEITAVCAAEQAALNLETGPLVRAVLFSDRAGGPGRLFVVIHHLVIDGVSWRVLLEDLLTAYRALRAGTPVTLPAPTATAAAWGRWLATWAATDAFKAEAAHWTAQAAAASGAVALPRDLPGTDNRVADAAIVAASLTPEETETLLRRTLAAYGCQINDLLLAALAAVLRDWTGRERTLIHLEGHGRESGDAGLDLSRSVGWFTSLFPVVLDVAGRRTPVEQLETVRSQLAAVPHRGVGYGVGRWAVSPPRWDVPAAEVCFNYLGQFDGLVGEGSVFAGASESVGPHCSPTGQRAHLIDVNALVVDGALRCEWHHGIRIHSRATIRGLAEALLTQLRALMAAAPAAGTAPRYELAGASAADVAAAIDEIEF